MTRDVLFTSLHIENTWIP